MSFRRTLGMVVVFVAILLNAANSFAGYEPKHSALVVDAETGKILHQENAGEQRYPASLTKMMTIYLTFRAIEQKQLSWEQRLPVSAHAVAQKPTKVGLRAGETISVKDALLSLVVHSANDSAVVLAEAIGGSENNFANIMTNTAAKLGMNNTTFKNASGLPNLKQKTTAYDMARLAIALRRDYPQYYPMFSRTEFVYRGRRFLTHNRVTIKYKGADGLKTGFIGASGFNLVTSAKRNGMSIVGVVMGGRSAKVRDQEMMKLLDKSFYRLTKIKQGRSELVYANTSKRINANKLDPQPKFKPSGTIEQNAGNANPAIQQINRTETIDNKLVNNNSIEFNRTNSNLAIASEENPSSTNLQGSVVAPPVPQPIIKATPRNFAVPSNNSSTSIEMPKAYKQAITSSD